MVAVRSHTARSAGSVDSDEPVLPAPAEPRRRVPGPVGLAVFSTAGLLAFLALRKGVPFDFQIYYQAAEGSSGFGGLYEPGPWWHGLYLYSPAFACVLAPLTSLPISVAYGVWTLLSLAALFLSVLCFDHAQGSGAGEEQARRRGPGGVALLVILFLLLPIMSNFRHGNSNTFPVLMIAASALLFSRGLRFWSGWLCAFAAAFKVGPVLLGLWFVGRKDLRGSLGFLLGTLCWLALIPALSLGPERALDESLGWVRWILLPVLQEQGPEILRDAGQSLPVLLRSAAEALPEGLHGVGETTARVVGLALAVAVLGLSLRRSIRGRLPAAPALALLAAAVVLVQPVSRHAAFLLMLPLVTLSAREALQGSRWHAGALGLAFALSLSLLLLARALGLPHNTFGPTSLAGFVVWIAWLPQETDREECARPRGAPGAGREARALETR